MHEEAEESKESNKVFPLPVSEMPNARVFGYRDPLKDSPIRRAKEQIESGNSPLYKNMSKESYKEASNDYSSGLPSEEQREMQRAKILKNIEQPNDKAAVVIEENLDYKDIQGD